MLARPTTNRPLLAFALMAVVASVGCGSASHGTSIPSLAPSAAHQRAAAENAMGMPGENAMGMPGENAMGMPGENAMGMPGAQFACTGIPAAGTASCTIAINLNVAPVPNPNQPPELIAGLKPADLQSAYQLPAQNAGGTVAIVDAYDNPAAEADLAVYRAKFGLGPCTSANGCFRKVNQRGEAAPPAANAAWSEEIALDLDMVSAACPRCTILLVEADSASMDDLGAAVDTAAALGAKAISNSYYAPEWSGETAEDAHYRHPGVAITASSGDRGYQSYPAVSRYVTAVGGTSLTPGASSWSETAWQYGGHGCSRYIAKPDWQHAAPCSSRSGVDVAAVADPQTGVATFNAQAGGWFVAGGTSVGAPLIAAAYALSGNPAGPAYSYRHANAFRAIGSGGYALATGLGSPLGVAGL
jgi:hypothetical protein